jgi:hypothetical protein
MELHDRDEVRRTGQWLTCPVRPPAAICATDPDQPNDTVRPDGSCVSIDLGGTVTHEAGHMLGLAHPCEFESNRDAGVRQCRTGSDPDQDVTMFPTSPIGDSSKRTLEDDDVAGVCTVYPRDGAPRATGGAGQSGSACASAASPPSNGGGGSGCSTAGPADGAPLLLVLAALARRRLRLR